MIEVTTLLIAVLIVVAALQPTDERLYTAFLFASLVSLHHIFAYNMEGIAYYGSAALLDMAVIFFTARLRILSSVIRSIQNICLASIALNAFGWVSWMLYAPPHAYNAAFIALYSLAIITLLKKEKTNADGTDSVGAWLRNFHPFSGESHHRSTKQQKAP